MSKGLQVLVVVVTYIFENPEEPDSITASNYIITPELSYYGTKTKVEFNGSCVKQDKIKSHTIMEK